MNGTSIPIDTSDLLGGGGGDVGVIEECVATTVNNNNKSALMNGVVMGDMGDDETGDENPMDFGADGLLCTKKEIGVLVVGCGAASSGVVAGSKKEDEKITSAVMKVLQGYQWSLVPTTVKYVHFSAYIWFYFYFYCERYRRLFVHF